MSKTISSKSIKGIKRLQSLKCPVCLFKKTRHVFSKYSSGNIFRFSKCDNCNLLFIANPIKATYDESYYSGTGIDQTVSYIDELKNETGIRTNEYEGLLGLIEKYNNDTKVNKLSILDYGCGTGSFLKYVKNKYPNKYTLFGYEPNSDLANNINGIKYFKKETDLLIQCEGKIDLVIATEVIEHIKNPRNFAKNIKNVLKQGGVFIYTTGNTSSLYARIFGNKWPYLIPEIHIRFYCPNTMIKLFEDFGFKNIQANYDENFRKIITYRSKKNNSVFKNNILFTFLKKQYRILDFINGMSTMPFFIKK